MGGSVWSPHAWCGQEWCHHAWQCPRSTCSPSVRAWSASQPTTRIRCSTTTTTDAGNTTASSTTVSTAATRWSTTVSTTATYRTTAVSRTASRTRSTSTTRRTACAGPTAVPSKSATGSAIISIWNLLYLFVGNKKINYNPISVTNVVILSVIYILLVFGKNLYLLLLPRVFS